MVPSRLAVRLRTLLAQVLVAAETEGAEEWGPQEVRMRETEAASRRREAAWTYVQMDRCHHHHHHGVGDLLPLYASLSACLPVCLFICVCVSVAVSICVCLCVCVSVCVCVCLCLCVSVSLWLCLSVCVCVSLSLCVRVCVFSVSDAHCLLRVSEFVHPRACVSLNHMGKNLFVATYLHICVKAREFSI